jgi:hypothetical protein
MPDPTDAAGEARKAAQLARAALIIACMGAALSVLGLFLPI